MMILYNIFSMFAAIAIVPIFTLYSIFTGKKRLGLIHHFGLVPSLDSFKTKEGKVLWLHALSRGEVNAATPILLRIHEDCPDISIIVSVTTESGYLGANENLSFADQIIFHPFDCWPFNSLAIKRLQPDLFIVTDTGFWPGLIHALHKKNIPMILINGRISKKSIRLYKLFKSVASMMFKNFDKLFMQNKQSLEAVINLGANPSSVQICGDTKIDLLKQLPEQEQINIRKELLISVEDYIWVAGSTHAGEEIILFDAFEKLKTHFPDLILIIAPRRIERIREVEDLLKNRGLSYSLKSEITNKIDIILLDTMGELANIYSIANISFVGRSLIEPGGGHSLMEPIVQGKLVIHGPFIENVQDTAIELGKIGIGITVHSAEDIVSITTNFLEEESSQKLTAQKAQTYIEDKRGASELITASIREYLNN
ncbi:MAG: 3-deoxy-D-manno-octulosonic acid transferase [Nitrospinales bacterium]